MLLLLPGIAGAQPAAPAAALEGREVTVLMDMPATAAGVDLYLQREPDIDAASGGLRLKQNGTAIRRGDRVRLTLVKVNKKNIELQLAGGGDGTPSDDIGFVVDDLLGFPPHRRPSREGEFDASVEILETRRALIEVTFVAGLVVKISTSQR